MSGSYQQRQAAFLRSFGCAVSSVTHSEGGPGAHELTRDLIAETVTIGVVAVAEWVREHPECSVTDLEGFDATCSEWCATLLDPTYPPTLSHEDHLAASLEARDFVRERLTAARRPR